MPHSGPSLIRGFRRDDGKQAFGSRAEAGKRITKSRKGGVEGGPTSLSHSLRLNHGDPNLVAVEVSTGGQEDVSAHAGIGAGGNFAIP
jgi:hypothetical protein